MSAVPTQHLSEDTPLDTSRFSLLSKPAILRLLNHGIIIDPYNPFQWDEEEPVDQLKTGSYDVRLGKHFYRRGLGSDNGFFNPYDKEAVKEHFGDSEEAMPAREHPYWAKYPNNWKNITAEDLIIMVEPGEMILGHTNEFIGGTLDPETGRCFLSEMKARSSVGRLGFEVCRCAGWGDVGYFNRWTMEVVNTTKVPIVLVAGTRVAQMKFYEVETVEAADLYGASATRDHYQAAPDLDQLKETWRPEMMIPSISKK